MEPAANSNRLTVRFEEALVYAVRLHQDQYRKGSHIPYIAHLLSVCAMVLEDGGDEDQAVAAVLHDAVEDQGGYPILAEIRRRFGERVAMIVEGCTDSFYTPKPPWQERKEMYLDHLRTAPVEVRRVSLADKLHNARSLLVDLRQARHHSTGAVDGKHIWERFKGGKQGSLWYFRSLVHIFNETGGGPLAEELVRVVAEIEKLSGAET